MLALLGLGFVVGLQHALEADHLAAVATIASGHSKPGDIVRHGLTWGLGHTLTLLALSGIALLVGSAIPDSLSRVLEFGVGVMLAGLGCSSLWRLRQGRVHLHVHRHDGEAEAHLHPHSHAGESAPHAHSEHRHPHAPGFRWRTLAVGLMHGLAGSAALLLLAMTQVRDPVRGVAYILVFGRGSMVGMAAISALMAVPLALSARFLAVANRGLQAGIGVCTLCLGLVTMWTQVR